MKIVSLFLMSFMVSAADLPPVTAEFKSSSSVMIKHNLDKDDQHISFACWDSHGKLIRGLEAFTGWSEVKVIGWFAPDNNTLAITFNQKTSGACGVYPMPLTPIEQAVKDLQDRVSALEKAKRK